MAGIPEADQRQPGWIRRRCKATSWVRDALRAADRRKAALRYVALVAATKGIKLWDEALAEPIFLGSLEIVERMLALVDLDPPRPKGIPQQQRCAPPEPIQ